MNSPHSGWYPNPQNPAEQRYWDGSAWTDHVAPLNAPEPTVALPTADVPPPPPPFGAQKKPAIRWYQRRWVWVVGGVIAVLAIIGAVTPSSDKAADANARQSSPLAPATETVTAPAQPTVTATVTLEPTPTRTPTPTKPPTPASGSQVGNNEPVDDDAFTLPDERGKNLQAAQDDLQAVSGNPFYYSSSEDAMGEDRLQLWDSNWKVCSQEPRAGKRIKTDSDELVTFYVVRTSESCP